MFPQTLADPVLTRRHARRLRSHSFDVALAHQATTTAGLASALPGVPLASVFHASVVLEMQFLRSRVPATRRAAFYLLAPFIAALERKAIRSANGLLVLSRFARDLLRSRYPQAAARVRVVGAGVDDAFFAEPNDPEECRRRLGIPPGLLLFTARRLEPRMGLEILIDSLALLDDEQVVLAVAGTGALHQALERRVHRLGLERRAHLLGQISEDDLRSLYAAADLFVLPTIADEGFGMSTVEALAAGTPALGTAVGATPEILGELGPEFVVPAGEPSALAAGIRRVVPLLGPELRGRARRLAEDRYRWDSVIVRWEDALSAVVRG